LASSAPIRSNDSEVGSGDREPRRLNKPSLGGIAFADLEVDGEP
jgi:hypothetical protein